MTGINAFIKKYSVLCYYLLTFAISWGGVFLVAGGVEGFPATEEELNNLLPMVVMALALAPSLRVS